MASQENTRPDSDHKTLAAFASMDEARNELWREVFDAEGLVGALHGAQCALQGLNHVEGRALCDEAIGTDYVLGQLEQQVIEIGAWYCRLQHLAVIIRDNDPKAVVKRDAELAKALAEHEAALRSVDSPSEGEEDPLAGIASSVR